MTYITGRCGSPKWKVTCVDSLLCLCEQAHAISKSKNMQKRAKSKDTKNIRTHESMATVSTSNESEEQICDNEVDGSIATVIFDSDCTDSVNQCAVGTGNDPKFMPNHYVLYEEAIRQSCLDYCLSCERLLFPEQVKKLSKKNGNSMLDKMW